MTRNTSTTSLDAAESALRGAAGTRDRVRQVVALHGPLTLDQLVSHYMRYRSIFDWKLVSPQSIRSRCAELVAAGVVESVPLAMGKSPFGRDAQLWRIRLTTMP